MQGMFRFQRTPPPRGGYASLSPCAHHPFIQCPSSLASNVLDLNPAGVLVPPFPFPQLSVRSFRTSQSSFSAAQPSLTTSDLLEDEGSSSLGKTTHESQRSKMSEKNEKDTDHDATAASLLLLQPKRPRKQVTSSSKIKPISKKGKKSSSESLPRNALSSPTADVESSSVVSSLPKPLSAPISPVQSVATKPKKRIASKVSLSWESNKEPVLPSPQAQLKAKPRPKSGIKPAFIAPFDRYSVQQKMHLTLAYLDANDCQKAEILVNRLCRDNPNNLSEILTNLIVGEFIRYYISEAVVPAGSDPIASYDKAVNWWRRLKETTNRPNTNIYAFFLQYLCSLQIGLPLVGESTTSSPSKHQTTAVSDNVRSTKWTQSELNKWIKRMSEEGGLDPSSLYQHPLFFETPEWTILEKTLSVMQKTPSMRTTAINHFLLSTMKAEEEKSTTTPSDNMDDPDHEAAAVAAATPDPNVSRVTPVDSNSVAILDTLFTNLSAKLADIPDPVEKQLLLEDLASEAARLEREAAHEKLPGRLKLLGCVPRSLISSWHQAMTVRLEQRLKEFEVEGEQRIRCQQNVDIFPFLKLFKASELSEIVIAEALRLKDVRSGQKAIEASFYGRQNAVAVATYVGDALESAYNLWQSKKRENKALVKRALGINKLHSSGRLYNMAIRRLLSEQERLKEASSWFIEWPSPIKLRLGAYLLRMLVDVAKVPVHQADPTTGKAISVMEPAFIMDLEVGKTEKVNFFTFHEQLRDIILKFGHTGISSWKLPMLTVPQPWLSCRSGGYFKQRELFVRMAFNIPEHTDDFTARDEQGEFLRIFQALDVLGSTAWRISPIVFHTAMHFWNAGIEIKNLPAILPPFPPLPELPADCQVVEMIWARNREKRARENLLSANFSQRCDTSYKLKLAEVFLNETLYFPHSIDFRGRAYPIPPHLSHMGNDLCRGMLVFAKKKALGTRGLDWLKIQVASLAGKDKSSLDERIAFTDAHIADIMDSANNPIHGKGWWRQSDSPWQLLASCHELANALKSPDPTQYESSLPIHQDGSCNGLQHYAALGGDEQGAKQVNLLPSERPQDIYSAVGAILEGFVNRDAENGVKEAQLLKGRINRKLVKQTVMTNTYGVTFVGAREQIQNRLKEARNAATVAGGEKDVESNGQEKLTDEEIWTSSIYATKRTFESLGKLFTGAQALQAWLVQAGAIITKSVEASVIPPKELELSRTIRQRGLIPGFPPLPEEEGCDVEKSDTSVKVEESAAQKDANGPIISLLNEVLTDKQHAQMEAKEEALKKEEARKAYTSTSTRDVSWEQGSSVAAKRKAISKTAGISWTTPLGLPIHQPYKKFESRMLTTPLQRITVWDTISDAPYLGRKQIGAFPPNFVHSLDATHMMMTASACQEAGLTFASVHDSYWTHAADVDTMNQTLREAFVKLHSQDVLGRLRAEFLERYQDRYIPMSLTIPVSDLKNTDGIADGGESVVDMSEDDLNEAADLTESDEATTARLSTDKSKAKGASSKRSTKGGGKVSRTIKAWVPFSLPSLPERGRLDLEQVKRSVYFFH